jgi:phosphoenolpyruvate carboxylase
MGKREYRMYVSIVWYRRVCGIGAPPFRGYMNVGIVCEIWEDIGKYVV